MKKILILFVMVCLILAIYSVSNHRTPSDELDVVGEIIETIDDYESKTMVCTKRGNDLFTEQKIFINFDVDDLVSDVVITEKYSSKEIAESSYDTILSDDNNSEVMIDGNTVSYNATESFEYKGKTKQEMIEIMNEFKTDGINTGYIISWQ